MSSTRRADEHTADQHADAGRGRAQQEAEGEADEADAGRVDDSADDHVEGVGERAVALAAVDRLAEDDRGSDGDAAMANTEAASTADFARRTEVRRPTAANVVRIMPVVYSPATNSTPRTPTMSWPSAMPARARSSGSSARRRARGLAGSATTEKIMPNTTMTTPAASSVNIVERTERNLIHSPRATRRADRPVGGGAVASIVTGSSPCR